MPVSCCNCSRAKTTVQTVNVELKCAVEQVQKRKAQSEVREQSPEDRKKRKNAEGPSRSLGFSNTTRAIVDAQSRTGPVFLVQFSMAAGQWDFVPIDEQVLYLCPYFERVSISDDDIRNFPGLDRSDLIRHAKDFGGIDRHCLESFLPGKTECSGHSGMIGEVAHVRGFESLKSDLDPSLGQHAGVCKRSIIRVIFVLGQPQNRPDQHRNAL